MNQKEEPKEKILEKELIELEIEEKEKSMELVPKRESQLQDIKFIFEFEYNAIKETTLMLSKGMSFYLAITAALVGYVLTQDLDVEIKNQASIIGIVVSFFALIASSSISWGILTGLNSLNKLLIENNPELYYKLGVNKFIRRGIIAVVIVMVCALAVLGTFSFAILMMS